MCNANERGERADHGQVLHFGILSHKVFGAHIADGVEHRAGQAERVTKQPVLTCHALHQTVGDYDAHASEYAAAHGHHLTVAVSLLEEEEGQHDRNGQNECVDHLIHIHILI